MPLSQQEQQGLVDRLMTACELQHRPEWISWRGSAYLGGSVVAGCGKRPREEPYVSEGKNQPSFPGLCLHIVLRDLLASFDGAVRASPRFRR